MNKNTLPCFASISSGFAPALMLTLFFAFISLPQTSRANDGRDRYQRGYPNLLEHLHDAVAADSGYRVLAEDMEGGADGNPAYRWAQPQALALVEVAARHTFQALGTSPYPMALFDFAAENGDTPVDFYQPAAGEKNAKPKAPRGRHPGGSHDGGLNLDLGYYLKSLQGKFIDPDFAACTDHYDDNKKDKDGKVLDLQQCKGPADRLDVEHQAFFVLELLKINRSRFAMHLLDQGGMDQQVQRAVLAQLKTWLKQHKYGVQKEHLGDLKRLFVHDPWGGWARYHHHHLHLRLLADSASGAQLQASQQLIQEARFVRAGLLAKAHPDWPMALDARLLSYKLERAVELHLLPLREHSGYKLEQVRYQIDDGKWQAPPALDEDNAALVIDLQPGLYPPGKVLQISAELVDKKGNKTRLERQLALPRLDPRLFAKYIPGQVQGHVRLRNGRLSASVDVPASLLCLITEVRYQVYDMGHAAEPAIYVVTSARFAQDSARSAPAKGNLQTAKDDHFRLRIKLDRDKEDPPVGLVQARLILSGRKAVDIPLLIQAPASTSKK